MRQEIVNAPRNLISFRAYDRQLKCSLQYSLEGIQVCAALCSICHESSCLIEIFLSRSERVSSYNELRRFTEALRDLLGLVLDVANEPTGRHGDSEASCDPVSEWGFGIGSIGEASTPGLAVDSSNRTDAIVVGE